MVRAACACLVVKPQIGAGDTFRMKTAASSSGPGSLSSPGGGLPPPPRSPVASPMFGGRGAGGVATPFNRRVAIAYDTTASGRRAGPRGRGRAVRVVRARAGRRPQACNQAAGGMARAPDRPCRPPFPPPLPTTPLPCFTPGTCSSGRRRTSWSPPTTSSSCVRCRACSGRARRSQTRTACSGSRATRCRGCPTSRPSTSRCAGSGGGVGCVCVWGRRTPWALAAASRLQVRTGPAC
jgi:hypothetical protein